VLPDAAAYRVIVVIDSVCSRWPRPARRTERRFGCRHRWRHGVAGAAGYALYGGCRP